MSAAKEEARFMTRRRHATEDLRRVQSELEGMGYDPSDRIIIDEMQAYLLHTPARYMPLADVPGPAGVDIAKIRNKLQKTVTTASR